MDGSEARVSEVWDVVVVGAGMAGLMCARMLAEQGVRVLIVEARDRVGGRVCTERSAEGAPVEMGAEFVHGRPEELLALIAEAGCEMVEVEGTQMCLDGGALAECDEGRGGTFDALEELKTFAGKDVSFAAYLEARGVGAQERGAATGYVEGFNAADAQVVSARALGRQQAAEDAMGGDRAYRVREGYDRLPEFLAKRVRAAGGEVRLGTRVRRIAWRQGRVAVETDGGALACSRAVITLPLGVLLGGGVAIEPEPVEVMRAAGAMRMGEVCRFTMRFRRRWWEAMEPQPAMRAMSFLLTFGQMPPVWWTRSPEPSPTLTGWVGGPGAKALAGSSAEVLAERASEVLARVFGVTKAWVRAEMTECLTYDWSADAFSRGAYSYVAAGGAEASLAMSEPVSYTLHFAGEHTDVTGHWGTVHGAMRSGLRAAGQVLESTTGQAGRSSASS